MDNNFDVIIVGTGAAGYLQVYVYRLI